MTTTNDLPAPDVRLHVLFEPSPYNGPGMTAYAHVYVQPVVLARAKYGDKRWDAHDPDSYSIDAPASVRALAGLRVKAQADNHADGHSFYAYKVAYDGDMDLRKMDAAHPVLRRIDKRMTVLADRFGHPRDLPAFLAHLADALLPKTPRPFIRRVEDGNDFEGTGYRSMDAAGLRYYLDGALAEWRKSAGTAVDR